MLSRRAFVAGSVALLAAPRAVEAQQAGGRVPRIGFVPGGALSTPITLRVAEAFRQGLREYGGYIEGQSIVVEYRSGAVDERARSVADLIRLNVDVIVAGGTPVALVAKQATSTIPIIVGAMADPVADGLVTSLARPGGNITGNTFLAPELGPKRLQLLREVVPGVRRVAILQHSGVYAERTMQNILEGIKSAALGIELQVLEATGPNDFDAAFAAMAKAHAGALIVLPSPMFYINYRRIVDLAAKHRLPAMYVGREFVEAGGLMCYGADIPGLFHRAAAYVDKILKGTKPGDLPVEQPTKFELVINLKTAKALGLTIPPSLLLRADQVIESPRSTERPLHEGMAHPRRHVARRHGRRVRRGEPRTRVDCAIPSKVWY
jgi:putative ABC transport system substrate-binding protein